MHEDIVDKLIAKAVKLSSLTQGAYLFHQDDPVRSLFVIDEGRVELTRHQKNGASIILQRADNRAILAEASMYSEKYHCDAIIAEPTRVFELPKSVFLNYLHEDDKFSNLWVAHLAKEVQSARYRSEILSLKTVAERLDGWLAWRGPDLPPKGQWKTIAAQIGVSPEALYRELAKRKFRQ